MFSSTINQLENQLSFNQYASSSSQCNNSILDIQYQLYSKYIQLSKQQFIIKQLSIINDTHHLIQFMLKDKNIQTQNKQSKSTMNSFSYQENSSILLENSILSNDFSQIQRKSPKKITRKTTTRQSMFNHILTNRNNQEFQSVLQDIQKNCNQKTYNLVNSILNDHKKNINRFVDVEKKQKSFRRMQENSQKNEQQNLLLKNKMLQIQEKLKVKDEEIKGLKQKLAQIKILQKQNLCNNLLNGGSSSSLLNIKETNNCSSSQASTTNSQPCNQKNFLNSKCLNTLVLKHQSLISLLNQKQIKIQSRLQKIQQIQQKIQVSIQQSILSSSNQLNCVSKCCLMIKKIKQSVMNYRNYLQQQAGECQKLYNILKKQWQQNWTKNYENSNNNRFMLMEQKVQINY